MTEPRQRRVGAYAKLLANYASDDAIIDAGEKAELLFIRGLAFLATSDSDGYITDAQLIRFVGAGMRDAAARARTLARVGVWERVDGGYVVRSWTKIHETAEEKGYKRKADRERKRLRPDSDRNPDGTPPEGGSESLLGSYVSSSPPTEHDSATHDTAVHDNASQGRAATPEPSRPPSMFCPNHPNGTTEKCGPCADARRIYGAWVKETAGREAERRSAALAAIAACDQCDSKGFRLDPETKKPIGKCNPHRRTA